MKKIIIAISLLILMSIPVIADDNEQDYSTIKGDYKIICLGDTKDVVMNKIKYLKKQKEMTENPFGYTVKILDTTCRVRFNYYNNRLQQINIILVKFYYIDDFNNTMRNFIENQLNPMFEDLYGEPTTNYNYPNILECTNGYITYIAIWDIDKKIIKTGIGESRMGSGKIVYQPIITISDKEITNAQQQEENDSQSDMINNAKKDF